MATGTDCTVPPISADFYPFWSLSSSAGQSWSGQSWSGQAPSGVCVWNFGKAIQGVTKQDFGGDAQYGTPNVARYGGTIISQPTKNPEFSGSCGNKKY